MTEPRPVPCAPADRKIVDVWVKTSDKPSFLMARRLIREEGLLCGGSSGTAVYAACQVTPVATTKPHRGSM